MLRYLLPRNLQPGTRPGDLAASDAAVRAQRPLRIRHVAYDETEVTETEYANFDNCPDDAPPGQLSWLHFEGDVPASVLRRLRESFRLHPLAVEDVQNIGQRPKLEFHDQDLFVTMALPVRTEHGLDFEQISIFAGADHVLSFHAGGTDIFAPVRRRLHEGKGRIRTGGADYLLYALADVAIDHGFPIVEHYADVLDQLEDEIFTQPRSNPVGAIHGIKRDLIGLRKVLWHQSVMIGDLLRGEHPLIDDESRAYFRDADDHARRINDLLDGYRDACSSLLDTHLSLSSARLNDVMKVLTLIATIFMPLSFLAGIYGMNFSTESPYNMPELGYRYAYPILMGTMAALAACMLALFRRRKWL